MIIYPITMLEDYQQICWDSAFDYLISLFRPRGLIYWLFDNSVEMVIPFAILIAGFIVFSVFKLIVSRGRDY